MNAERVVDILLEAWTREDWRWIYEQADQVLDIVLEAQERYKANSVPKDGIVEYVNAQLLTKDLPVVFTDLGYWSIKGVVAAYSRESKKVTLSPLWLLKLMDKLPGELEYSFYGSVVHEFVHYLQHKRSGFRPPNPKSKRPQYWARPEEMTAHVAGNAVRSGGMSQTYNDMTFDRVTRAIKDQKVRNRWRSTLARHGYNLDLEYRRREHRRMLAGYAGLTPYEKANFRSDAEQSQKFIAATQDATVDAPEVYQRRRYEFSRFPKR